MTSLKGGGNEPGETALGRSHGGAGDEPGSTGGDHDHGNCHHALIYEEQDEQFDAVAPFLSRGLERGERCLYIADHNSPDAVLEALRNRGVDVDAAVDSGALAVLTPEETYRRSGGFDREATLAFWREVLADAESDGYTGIRATGEMTWALGGEVDSDRLIEYEALLNPFYEDDRYTVLCQYDRTRFADEVIEDVIETHPLIVHGDTISQNAYYTPPEKFFGPDRPGDRVDRKLRTLRERTESETALQSHEQYLHALYEIVGDADRSFEETLSALLDLGCERFDMEMGGLARVDAETDRFEVEATNGDHDDLVLGSQYPLSETYCRATVAEGETCAVTDTAAFEGDLCYERFGVRTYLGTYLEFDDADDRTFWFVSRRSRDEISAGERAFHDLMGQWVRYELQQRRQIDRFAALNDLSEAVRDINRALVGQSTREEVERVVCDRLTGSDSYAFAWIDVAEGGDIVPTTGAAARADWNGLATLGTGGLSELAAGTGEPQVLRDVETRRDSEPWRELADERGISGVASVPVAYETERYGVLTVYTTRERAFDERERETLAQLGEITGLAITAIDHERELTRERERLEFFNRLVRHNLLNSLNVVSARADFLDGAVDSEAAEHLEMVRERTEEMIDLVGGLRSLMKAVATDERELEAVDLGTAVETRVEQARQTFDGAQFTARGDIAASGDVLADDLLDEALENLLVNAVEHNDKETPRIEVGVETSETELTVHIADNGPGVDDDLKEQIFEKGAKGFDSHGTGFGLHLAREIIESYDGTIRVEDRDPEGTVFSISLPRATAST